MYSFQGATHPMTIETFVVTMASTLIFSVSEDEILIREVQNTLLYYIGDLEIQIIKI
jgi:hypothetical protein